MDHDGGAVRPQATSARVRRSAWLRGARAPGAALAPYARSSTRVPLVRRGRAPGHRRRSSRHCRTCCHRSSRRSHSRPLLRDLDGVEPGPREVRRPEQHLRHASSRPSSRWSSRCRSASSSRSSSSSSPPVCGRGSVGIAIELLAAIPSIIYGMWGLFVFAPFMAAHVQPALKARTSGFLPLLRRAADGDRHAHRRDHPGPHDPAVHHRGDARRASRWCRRS